MRLLFPLLLLAGFLAPLPLAEAMAGEACTVCHLEEARFSPYHDPRLIGCTSCHGGDGTAREKAPAHAGLEPYPGRIATAAASCGQSTCHERLIPIVANSIMHTLEGMVGLTRRAFGEHPAPGGAQPLSARLADGGMDSYLRKLCVSCHLGSERRNHGQAFEDRGGGCAACHLQTFPGAEPPPASLPSPPPSPDLEVRRGIHPRLTLAVADERCLGCHAGSGRIALNYLGWAEAERLDPARREEFGRLPDNRLVEKRPPDVHRLAGMACIDCHTASGLMGTGGRPQRQRQQLDIQCDDCHGAAPRTIAVKQFTWRDAKYPVLNVFRDPAMTFNAGAPFATARKGTPLFHLRGEGSRRVLRTKLGRRELEVPLTRPGPHHDLNGHERLTCEACHAAWAPQCYGCHISYDAGEPQHDHLLGRATPGRWREQRWAVRSGPPALGVTAENHIAPFVPGMSLILERKGRTMKRVRFSQLSPHTTGKQARSCKSCHQQPGALGLITGRAVMPGRPELSLPIGWVAEGAPRPGLALQLGARSLERNEIARALRVGACLDCHPGTAAFYADYPRALRTMPKDVPHRRRRPVRKTP